MKSFILEILGQL